MVILYGGLGVQCNATFKKKLIKKTTTNNIAKSLKIIAKTRNILQIAQTTVATYL